MNRKEGYERVTLSVVREAYFRGDFERCIDLCDAFRARDDADIVEVTLLRARSLLPLNRPETALETLRALRLSEGPSDEYLTAQMLIGTAYVALGQHDHGLKILKAAHLIADGAHRTVQAEVLVNLAVAHYRKKQLGEAQSLLDAVPPDADIIYARALEYSGWVAWARNDFDAAVGQFTAALRCIDACRHYDRFVEAKSLYGLAFLCGELPRLDLWPEIALRAARFDWSVSGVAVWRYWLAIEASFATELLGDRTESTRWASLAEKVAPSPSCRVVALCRLAALFGRYGETGAHAYFVDKARATYDELTASGTLRDEPSLPLSLAEEVANSTAPEDAASLLTFYAESLAPRMRGHADESRMEASKMLVEGQLEEIRGNHARSQRAYLSALAYFKEVGFRRRAAVVAYRLAVLTGDDTYRSFIDEALSGVSDSYWVKARIAERHLEMRLSDRHAHVLRLVAQGMTNKEIATARGVSFFTARNMVRELLVLFKVRTRGELAALAAARANAQPRETTPKTGRMAR
jgi:DNA-binding CsgD family transcriptional regulator